MCPGTWQCQAVPGEGVVAVIAGVVVSMCVTSSFCLTGSGDRVVMYVMVLGRIQILCQLVMIS